MNRLQHLLRSRGVYSLHSPFLYGFYTRVVMPRVGKGEARDMAKRMADRIAVCYGGRMVGADGSRPDGEWRVVAGDMEFLVVQHPHRAGELWGKLCRDDHWQVALDFYDVGILIHHTALHREQYILR